MATVIKSTHPRQIDPPLELTDLGRPREALLQDSRAEAARIIAEAEAQADRIRADALRTGKQAGLEAARLEAETRTAQSLRPLLQAVVQEISTAREEWLADWESRAMQLATGIARRILRRELSGQCDLPVRLAAEALQLVAGKTDIRIVLSPDDHRAFSTHVADLTTAAGTTAEIVSDASMSRGGCRVETRYGVIDQTIEAQLERIERELA